MQDDTTIRASGNTMKKVLIIDDDNFNIAILGDMLASSGYEVITALKGEDGLRLALQEVPDVVLLDVVLPGIDGFAVCRKLKSLDATRHVPVIMMTGLSGKDSKHKGLEAGAVEFLNKPVDMVELTIRLKNVIEIKEYHDYLKNHNAELEKIVEKRTIELRHSFVDTIYRLTLMAEYKDKGTASHIRRVSHYTALLSRLLGLSEKETDILFNASPMHDIGKIGIPDEILQSSNKLTEEQYKIMQSHTVIGGSVLVGSGSDYLKSAKRFALYHHEHWDGTGYPYGLKGAEIPIEGRIMLIADRYDAVRSERPYKKSFDHDTAVNIIIENNERSSSKHFDPGILDLFMKNHERFNEIYEEHKDVPVYAPETG